MYLSVMILPPFSSYSWYSSTEFQIFALLEHSVSARARKDGSSDSLSLTLSHLYRNMVYMHDDTLRQPHEDPTDTWTLLWL